MRREILFALLLLLLFSACSSGPKAVDRYVGTEGLAIEFAQNAPPDIVYEGTAFPVRVLVHNSGAQDVPYDKFLLMFSADPLYISGGISPYLPNERDPAPRGVKILYGKSPGFPTGEQEAFGMPIDNAFQANTILGQREQPETTIAAGICYSYVTHYSGSVCVDTNAYQENLRTQPCQAEELTSVGGQGAPIAITSVKVQGFPVIDRELGIEATRPYFTLSIENVGGGQLVGPDTLDFQKACLLQSIPKEQLGAVRISAYLLNTPLKCQPDGLVRLVDGKGEVRCTVEDNELANPIFASAQNYRSTLIVNLSYLYKSSTSATVSIERVPGDRPGEIIPVGGRVTGYEYIRAGATIPQATLPGDDQVQLITTGPVVTDASGTEWQLLATPDGQAVNSCELYANNPTLIPESQSQLKDVLDPRWSCACGQTRCAVLARSGQCLASLCPGTTYCCTDQAANTPETTTTETPVPVTGAVSGIGSEPSKSEICQALESAAAQYGIPPDTLKAMAYQESGWDNTPAGSNDGGLAHGIMQIHEKYHPDYDIARGEADASYNIAYGASFLAQLYARYKDWRTAIARYNGSDAYATKILSLAEQKPWVSRGWCTAS